MRKMICRISVDNVASHLVGFMTEQNHVIHWRKLSISMHIADQKNSKEKNYKKGENKAQKSESNEASNEEESEN